MPKFSANIDPVLKKIMDDEDDEAYDRYMAQRSLDIRDAKEYIYQIIEIMEKINFTESFSDNWTDQQCDAWNDMQMNSKCLPNSFNIHKLKDFLKL